MNLSQPAVSNSLELLREYFDDALLVRHIGKLHLTSFAERLRGPVRHALVNIRAVTGTRPLFLPAMANRRFRMVMSSHLMSLVMAPLLANVACEAPEVTLQSLDNDGDVNAFPRDEIDLLIPPE